MSEIRFRIQGFIVWMIIAVPFVTIEGQDAQWLGPNRNSIFKDTLLLKEWPAEGPEILFATAGTGMGFSSAVATKDRIYATGMKDTMEYLTVWIIPVRFSGRIPMAGVGSNPTRKQGVRLRWMGKGYMFLEGWTIWYVFMP